MQSVSRFALLVCLSVASAATIALPAYAATRTSSTNNFAEAVKSPVSKPTSAWLVGPSQASSFDAKDHPDEQGCLMVAEFDNGMIVGIHARAAGIVGMTVDTKQQTLAAGQPATMGLNLGGDSYVMNAVATDSSTMAVSLDEAGGGKSVVERLTGLGNFRLLIGEKPYYFATTGFTDGLARLQECMGANMSVPVMVTGPHDVTGKIKRSEPIETMKVTSSGNATPIALAMPSLVPTGYRFVLDDVDPMTPISWQMGDDWVDVMRQALAPHGLKMSITGHVIHITQRTGDSDPVVETQQSDDEKIAGDTQMATPESIGVWTANKGDNLGSVLEAWGMMAGVNVKVDLMDDLILPDDVKYNGNFKDAVQQLLSQYSGKTKPVSIMANASGAQKMPRIDRVASTPKTPMGRSSYSTRTDTWKPRSPSEIKALQKEWAPMKQMAAIPDPDDAPKVAKPDVKEPAKKADAKADTKSAKKGSKSLNALGNWQALQGTSLRDVLEHWGQRSDVKVVWMTDQNYPLPQSLQEQGKFEDAVMKALAQYADQATHPEGQLNQDPKTGEKVLIIKSSGS